MAAYEAECAIGDVVWVDADESATLVVLAVCFYARDYKVKLGWMANGDSKEAWFDSFRVTLARSAEEEKYPTLVDMAHG